MKLQMLCSALWMRIDWCLPCVVYGRWRLGPMQLTYALDPVVYGFGVLLWVFNALDFHFLWKRCALLSYFSYHFRLPKSSKHLKSSSVSVWTHSNIVLFAVFWQPQGKHCLVWLFSARLIQNQETQIVSFFIWSWYLWVEQKDLEAENGTFMSGSDVKTVTHFEESINVPHSWDEIRNKWLQFVVKLYCLWSISERNSRCN